MYCELGERAYPHDLLPCPSSNTRDLRAPFLLHLFIVGPPLLSGVDLERVFAGRLLG